MLSKLLFWGFKTWNILGYKTLHTQTFNKHVNNYNTINAHSRYLNNFHVVLFLNTTHLFTQFSDLPSLQKCRYSKPLYHWFFSRYIYDVTFIYVIHYLPYSQTILGFVDRKFKFSWLTLPLNVDQFTKFLLNIYLVFKTHLWMIEFKFYVDKRWKLPKWYFIHILNLK